MLTIELKDYKQYGRFLCIFDKELKNKKEKYLSEKGISPSSYRRAKRNETKSNTTLSLINDLCRLLEYKSFTENELIELEKEINKVYQFIYFRYEYEPDDLLVYFNNIISSNSILFPIASLIRLFIILTKKDPKKNLNKYKDEYEELKYYKDFFIGGLEEIYEIVEISFAAELTNDILFKKYKNGLTKYNIASKCLLEDYVSDCFRFLLICENMFLRDRNYRRMYFVDNTKMAYNNKIENYKESYIIGKRNFASIGSFKDDNNKFGDETKLFITNYLIACMGLKKYDDAYDTIIKYEYINSNVICCLTILNYINSKYEINKFLNDKNKYLYNVVKEILETKTNKKIEEINDYSVSKSLIKIMVNL